MPDDQRESHVFTNGADVHRETTRGDVGTQIRKRHSGIGIEEGTYP